MSKFVNFKKRSISLPAGCKDLIDLLDPTRRHKVNELIAPRPDVKVTRDDSFIGCLSEIGGPVSAALESQALVTMLEVVSLDDQLSFDLHRMDAEEVGTSVSFTQTRENEEKMRAIFKRSGLQIPIDSDVPGHFLKDQPVHLIYQIMPEPVSAADLTAVATAIFQGFCGLEPSSKVRVRLLEFTNAT